MLQRSEHAPYAGIISFNIFVHRLLPDGSLDPEVLDCAKDFDKIGMSGEAELSVTGFSLEECLTEIKNKIERLINDGS
jgi:hypothetical protein